YEEPTATPGEFIPAFLRIVERFLEDILEEVLAGHQAAEQEYGKHHVENRDLDLDPHWIASHQSHRAKGDRDGGSDERKDRQSPEDAQHHCHGQTRGDDQGPGSRIDAGNSIDDKHRNQRAELAEDIYRLLSGERKQSP